MSLRSFREKIKIFRIGIIYFVANFIPSHQQSYKSLGSIRKINKFQQKNYLLIFYCFFPVEFCLVCVRLARFEGCYSNVINLIKKIVIPSDVLSRVSSDVFCFSTCCVRSLRSTSPPWGWMIIFLSS